MQVCTDMIAPGKVIKRIQTWAEADSQSKDLTQCGLQEVGKYRRRFQKNDQISVLCIQIASAIAWEK